MSKGPWKARPRCQITGLLIRDVQRLEEEYLNNDGTFNTAPLSDCNLFDVRSIASAAGYSDSKYFIETVIADPSSPLHLHELCDEELGKPLVLATHSNSAAWGGKEWRAKTLKDQTGYDPTSGTSVATTLKAVVAD